MKSNEGPARGKRGDREEKPELRKPGISAPPAEAPSLGSAERLQKILARAGVASRRAAEEMIAAGRVSVNGRLVTEMGTRADPATDRIEVDGRAITITSTSSGMDAQHIYIMLNKPLGVVSTARDPQGRPTVTDLVRRAANGDQPHPPKAESRNRLYPVGRLDADSTGLILLTNDGDLTFRLTHPRFGVEKEYHVLVRGRPNMEALKKLREGVEIEGEKTAPARVEETGKRGDHSWLNVTIHEGRKRQVRLMCAAVGHPVIELERIRFGPLSLGNLQPGKWRHLAVHEVHALRKTVRLRAHEK